MAGQADIPQPDDVQTSSSISEMNMVVHSIDE
jgi:hypothetical protein